jgi:hypothetical protein
LRQSLANIGHCPVDRSYPEMRPYIIPIKHSSRQWRANHVPKNTFNRLNWGSLTHNTPSDNITRPHATLKYIQGLHQWHTIMLFSTRWNPAQNQNHKRSVPVARKRLQILLSSTKRLTARPPSHVPFKKTEITISHIHHRKRPNKHYNMHISPLVHGFGVSSCNKHPPFRKYKFPRLIPFIKRVTASQIKLPCPTKFRAIRSKKTPYGPSVTWALLPNHHRISLFLRWLSYHMALVWDMWYEIDMTLISKSYGWFQKAAGEIKQRTNMDD